jgi:hypothetical protein
MHALEGIVNKYSRKVAALEKVAETARLTYSRRDAMDFVALAAALEELDALDAVGEEGEGG